MDLLIEHPDGRLVGIEVKASASVWPNDFRGLQHLRDHMGARFVRGLVLYLASEGLTFDPRMCAEPVSALWRQAE